MYDLNRIGEHTYYIDSPTNVGIYENGGRVWLVDGGNDKDAAKKILRHIEEQSWTLDTVICTHSHADHVGGCALLKSRTGCRVAAPGAAASVVRYPYIMPSLLYGGCPPADIRSKFLMSTPCECEELSEEMLPEGLTYEHFDGHDFEQVAVKTSDSVWFTADAVISEETLQKYKVSFLYDIEKHLKALDKLESLSGELFVPAHSKPVSDITKLCRANRNNVFEVAEVIKRLCAEGLSADELLERVLCEFGIKLYMTQYALIGCTVRSYLSWLCARGEMINVYDKTRLLWKTVGK